MIGGPNQIPAFRDMLARKQHGMASVKLIADREKIK